MAKIMQWNINGLRNQYEQLQELIVEENLDIICLQETNLKVNQSINIKNYNCYNKIRLDCLAASGGASILVKNNIYSDEIKINTTIEAVAAKLILNNKNVTICNVYLSNKYELDAKEVQNLISQLPQPFILLGDFNSHSTLWGSNKNDKRGKIIEDIIMNNDLVLLNDTSATHFNVATGKSSAIDLTICSSELATSLEWHTLEYLYSSDHYPIIVSINQFKDTTRDTHNARWKFYKADWTKYKEIIESKITSLMEHIEENITTNEIRIDEIISKFNEIIMDAADGSIPKTNGRKQKHNTIWWNNECETVIKNAKKALNRYKKENTDENKIEYKKCKAIVKSTVKTSKINSWLKYLGSITYQTPVKEVWEKIKAVKNKPPSNIPVLIENGQIISEQPAIANILAESFAANSSDNNFSEDFLQFKNSSVNIPDPTEIQANDPINDKITLEELTEVLDSSKNTSPGPDIIPNILLKQLPASGIECLLKIYNIIWTHKLFPKIWKEAIVIPIPKPDKKKEDKNSYRPISLTCCMCKI